MTKTTFADQFISGHFGDTNTYKARLKQLSDFIYDYCLKDKGTATAAAVEALESPTNGDMYRIITSGGTVGELTTIVGDVVKYNATTETWDFLVTGAAINV